MIPTYGTRVFVTPLPTNNVRPTLSVCALEQPTRGMSFALILLLLARWPQARPLLSRYTFLRWQLNLQGFHHSGAGPRRRPGTRDTRSETATWFLPSP